jgi:hypothetical protein
MHALVGSSTSFANAVIAIHVLFAELVSAFDRNSALSRPVLKNGNTKGIPSPCTGILL